MIKYENIIDELKEEIREKDKLIKTLQNELEYYRNKTDLQYIDMNDIQLTREQLDRIYEETDKAIYTDGELENLSNVYKELGSEGEN